MPAASAGTVVFFDKGFPAIDNAPISRTALEQALPRDGLRFVGLDSLARGLALADSDLFVLPYGSAFPADAWPVILRHLDHGNLLIIGGKPLAVPVYRDSAGWTSDAPAGTYARVLGIEHSYEAPSHGPWKFSWSDNTPFAGAPGVNPVRVFVNAGGGSRYRGLGFMADENGSPLAAPVVADDLLGPGRTPRRRVYLSFQAEGSFWESPAGRELLRQTAWYAACGGVRIWLDLRHLALDPGESVLGVADVLRNGSPATLQLEMLSGTRIVGTMTMPCGNTLHQPFTFPVPRDARGLLQIRATLLSADTVLDRYVSGVTVRDSALLRTGARLEAGRDYFRRDGQPYLMVGTNYFSTDPYTSGFFVGGSIGGNAAVWERDFAAIEQQGFTAVRTGIWLNRARYLEPVSGAADERLLRAIESYLAAAARHHMQVIFTLFAFDPQVEQQGGRGQEGDLLGPGANPYIDPVALETQAVWVRSIAGRFKDVPFMSFDLINEPSITNPKRLWKGNSPNGDPEELAAWRAWLERRYGNAARLARAWRVPTADLPAFDRVPLPTFADLEFARSGNPNEVRAVDYNLFAQEVFGKWADAMIAAIRSAGAPQAVTVGQDEGGVADRVLNQFWAASGVSFTVNHTWWRDDALLWNSIAAKTPHKPNLIGETGLQPVLGVGNVWRWDELGGMGLEERKLVLGFAGGNAGVLHWDWSRDDVYSLLRRDGSYKQWMEAASGIAAFARTAQPYAREDTEPAGTVLVLPQSLQLSCFNAWSLTVQQNAIRALYHHARGAAVAVGEYQLENMPDAKLVIVPAPWVLSQKAWETLMERIRAGATLLVSGRIDADEHWSAVPSRARQWKIGYEPGALTAREVVAQWPAGSGQLTYSGERTTYGERGILPGGATFEEISLGRGRILYFAPPLELADQLDVVGRIYRYAMERAGVRADYQTSCKDPGILIAPTRLAGATLYVLTSESPAAVQVSWRDRRSGADLSVSLPPGRGALLLVADDGRTLARYTPH